MFDYIYGNKSRHFNFIRLPQVLFTDELFRPLSSDTKILYALLLDRTTLSIKKHWLDDEGRVYINFPISEISTKIGVGTQKAVKLMRELQDFGLIERVRIGLGKPDRIYVKHCGRSAENTDELNDLEEMNPKWHTMIITYYFGNNVTQADLGEKYGVSRQSISQTLGRAITLLRHRANYHLKRLLNE